MNCHDVWHHRRVVMRKNPVHFACSWSTTTRAAAPAWGPGGSCAASPPRTSERRAPPARTLAVLGLQR